MNALPIQISQAQFWKTRFQRGYRRGSLSLAAAGGLPCARASCRPTASAIRRMRGSRGSPLRDPLSLAGQHPFRSSSSAMPTLPRQGPSDGNSQEFRGGSRKFESSSCGVEMLAGGGLSLLWRYAAKSAAPFLSRMASPCRAGVIRSRSQAKKRGRIAPASRGEVCQWRAFFLLFLQAILRRDGGCNFLRP
jgi:hypothetical protein